MEVGSYKLVRSFASSLNFDARRLPKRRGRGSDRSVGFDKLARKKKVRPRLATGEVGPLRNLLIADPPTGGLVADSHPPYIFRLSYAQCKRA